MKKPGKKGLTAGLRVPTWVGTETPMERRSRYYLRRGWVKTSLMD